MLTACGLSIHPVLAPAGSAEFSLLEETLVDGSVCTERPCVIVHTGGHAAQRHRARGAVAL